MTLSMRPTVIGGETAEGDYSVYRDGRLIGRIRRTEDQVHRAWMRGSAESWRPPRRRSERHGSTSRAGCALAPRAARAPNLISTRKTTSKGRL